MVLTRFILHFCGCLLGCTSSFNTYKMFWNAKNNVTYVNGVNSWLRSSATIPLNPFSPVASEVMRYINLKLSTWIVSHYSDVTMGKIASQITSLTIVYLTVRRRSKKTSKLLVTGLCVGNSPVTGEFPAQMANNAENVSIWWRLHEWIILFVDPMPRVHFWKRFLTHRNIFKTEFHL